MSIPDSGEPQANASNSPRNDNESHQQDDNNDPHHQPQQPHDNNDNNDLIAEHTHPINASRNEAAHAIGKLAAAHDANSIPSGVEYSFQSGATRATSSSPSVSTVMPPLLPVAGYGGVAPASATKVMHNQLPCVNRSIVLPLLLLSCFWFLIRLRDK
jgi:hypothetical protein